VGNAFFSDPLDGVVGIIASDFILLYPTYVTQEIPTVADFSHVLVNKCVSFTATFVKSLFTLSRNPIIVVHISWNAVCASI
jgi:hypothetical protein